MQDPRRPSSEPPRRPPTTRSAAPSSRRAAAPPGPAKKNNLPIILGAAGGGLVLIIILAVALAGGDAQPPRKRSDEEKPRAEAPKKIVPDVSALEAEGKRKCEEGLQRVKPRLNPDPSAPTERVLADLESGLKLLKDGLEAYDKATSLAGKKYALDEYARVWKQGVKIFCTELEKEGQSNCDEGLKIIKSTESQMADTNRLSDDERKKLREDLQRGVKLISRGMGLFDRSYEVSGNRFETTAYQEAMKLARPKILELK